MPCARLGGKQPARLWGGHGQPPPPQRAPRSRAGATARPAQTHGRLRAVVAGADRHVLGLPRPGPALVSSARPPTDRTWRGGAAATSLTGASASRHVLNEKPFSSPITATRHGFCFTHRSWDLNVTGSSVHLVPGFR